jgi:hypothetical protein
MSDGDEASRPVTRAEVLEVVKQAVKDAILEQHPDRN